VSENERARSAHGKAGTGRGGRRSGIAFGTSVLGSIALTVIYAFGGQPQLEGVFLCISLGGLAAGLIVWGKELMPGGTYVEERATDLGVSADLEDAVDSFTRGEHEIRRRGFLAKMLGAALGALGVAALFPIRSLGAAPGRSLAGTPWGTGARLVTVDGVPVVADDVEVGGVLTVFPEGHTDSADAQTLLIRLEPGEYGPPPGREDWSPDGFVAFSKVCTHAGCPVGLYQRASQELFCPCHQSSFAVLEAARPTAGPATRPLPQLPLEIGPDGTLSARGDFPEPIGPGFWSRPRA
jgi:ubiquinol-cytochrome c reductase iron-sulfur subunit